MKTPGIVKLKVLRSVDDEEGVGFWQEYEVPFTPGRSVTGTLWLINELHDGSLAYRVSCHRGICASCIMRINGKQRLGTVIKDLVIEQA